MLAVAEQHNKMDWAAELMRRSAIGWQREYLKIIDKKSSLTPLVHNIAQLKVFNTKQLQIERGLPVRLIILKARQMGISTLIEAANFEDTFRRPNRHAVVISVDQDSTDKVFRMCKTFLTELPPTMAKPPLEYSNRKEIRYSRPHRSSILCQTAGKDVLGRGGTTHKIHATEIAFWANAEKQLGGATQEVPKEVGVIEDTEVVLESTACGVGGYFHDKYWEAVKRLRDRPTDFGGFLPVFLPWYIFPNYRMPLPPEMGGHLELIEDDPYQEVDYVHLCKSKGIALTDEQIYWRRWMIDNDCGGDLGMFKQEYPTTALEAFQSTGKMKFAPALLDYHEQFCCDPAARIWFETDGSGKLLHNNVNRKLDCWQIWKWPEKNHDYVFFGDVCEGLAADPDDPKSETDFHFAGVFDRETKEVVATFRGQCDTIPYGEQLYYAGVFYNWAWGSPEINSCGLAPLNELKRRNYPHIFRRRRKEEEIIDEMAPQLGWKTTTLNRKPSIETLNEVLKEREIRIYDRQVIFELRVFVNKNGKYQAQTGYHDDGVMMLVGLVQMHLLCMYGDAEIQQRSTSDRANRKERAAVNIAGAVASMIDEDLDEDDEDPYVDYGG